jgi:pyruvate dehydrogenase E1 component alpha subunit
MKLQKELLKTMYVRMTRIRVFEERAAELFAQGALHGTLHLSIGEEATAVGVCAAMEDGDMITQTHRGHSQAIATGTDLGGMMAELFGKATGTCGGYGGSMHIASLTASLGANGIVGGGIPLAAGSALSQQYLGKSNITACFFGDGAVNEGAFHETANLASVWKLPLLMVCENNLYGMSMHVSRSMHIDDIAQRALSYGMPAMAEDGNDVIAVYQAAVRARAAVLAGGPMLLVLNTYRWAGHSHSDRQLYRTQDEVEQWKLRCPIRMLRERLLEEDGFTQADLDALDAHSRAEVDRAVSFAQASPDPDPVDMIGRVYAERGGTVCGR